MSGIGGLFNQDGAPVQQADVAAMVEMLRRRGPDGADIWRRDVIALGQSRLFTTPEAARESMPLTVPGSGCVIVADARLDNRAEVATALALSEQLADLGDGELILHAYLVWGADCVDHLLGDFAFAVWDSHRQTLFCARDHFGVRPFYYHHTPGRFFAFASEPRAILVLPQTPYRINPGRIADFLVSQLEGIDKTSTFFDQVYRLPPAHTLTVTPQGMATRRYWTLEPGAELHLASDDDYTDAFLEVFTQAVQCRLRGDRVGSMLSGGMDSGSIVAVARAQFALAGRGPLPTFSAVAPPGQACVETNTIHAALSMHGLAPTLVDYGQLAATMPQLTKLTWSLDEPFDNHMTLIRVLYCAARRQGINVLLDGIDGDSLLSEGSYVIRLLRQGRWVKAYREATGRNAFRGLSAPSLASFVGTTAYAYLPNVTTRMRERLGRTQTHAESVNAQMRQSFILPAFAQEVDLGRRLEMLAAHNASRGAMSLGHERAWALGHPNLTVGVERYHRVASALGVEPRHPFLDRRLVTFCLSLPGSQKLDGGWPKIILRRAMVGRLSDAVRWRRGKEHLGWDFTQAAAPSLAAMKQTIAAAAEELSPYVDVQAVQHAVDVSMHDGDEITVARIFDVVSLANWLQQAISRPC
ncbi:MAG: hypothetical protein KDD78_03515 [Caldilineaceae bacterium]|nr:hypothetical protein [Caldilineaceae bacterium]